MSHLALYRKYRPQTFADVLGQEHIVRVLEGALSMGNISHAYLFSGGRGTGKTSVARIVARTLGVSDNDLYEMDGASTRGIDDIRELRESVRSLPFDSKYKVYIIDEVHMLTKEAFNALLKTLEEPPAHVIFILATTETEKIPETIISRCQCFSFKKPTDTVLATLALDTAKKEGYTLDQQGAELIALLGDGSFRDTHGIIQKVISFSKDTVISVKEIEKVTGAPSSQYVREYIFGIVEDNIERSMKSITLAKEEGSDMSLFLKRIIHMVRVLLLARLSPQMKKEFTETLSESEVTFIQEVLQTKSVRLNSRTLALLLEAQGTMKYAFISELPLELCVMKILEEGK